MRLNLMRPPREDPMAGARGILLGFVVAAALWAAILLLVAKGCEAGTLTQQRIAKARVVVSLYPHPGRHSFRPWVGTLIREHERYGDPEFAAAYWYSLVYGGANFSLRCYATAPGSCAGPMDVKHRPPVLDPAANIRHHVREMWTGWQNGYRGRGLCEYVMLPSRPHDWGGGKFAKADARHRARIRKAYREGEL
jgi:hypothetical protein